MKVIRSSLRTLELHACPLNALQLVPARDLMRDLSSSTNHLNILAYYWLLQKPAPPCERYSAVCQEQRGAGVQI